MTVCQLRIGDGRREVHERAYASIQEMLPVPDHVVVVDDSDHKLGFAGAIRSGWIQAIATGADWLVHLEMDFVFNAPPPLPRMIAVLEEHPYLAQICLKRGPVNDVEKAAGGIVETDPDSFEQKVRGGDIWTEHRRCFSTNPCVYPAALCHQGWPQESESEGKFTHRLLEDPAVRFAFWGAKFDEPLVEHIGQRIGIGY